MPPTQSSASFNPWNLFVGALIPNWLAVRLELSPGAKIAYARLCQFAGRDGVAYPTQPQLALAMGVTDRQVRRYLRELRGLAADGSRLFPPLIRVYRTGLRKANRITFDLHPWMQIEASPNVDNVWKTPPAARADRTQMSALERSQMSGPSWRRESMEENQEEAKPGGARRARGARREAAGAAVASPPRSEGATRPEAVGADAPGTFQGSAPRTNGNGPEGERRTTRAGALLEDVTRALEAGDRVPGVPVKRQARALTELARLAEHDRAAVYRFAGWLFKHDVGDELAASIVTDWIARPEVTNPYAYYAHGSVARARIEGALT